MSLRPKSKGMYPKPPKLQTEEEARPDVHYCSGHRFVKTPHGWRCDACQSPHYPGMSQCGGYTN